MEPAKQPEATGLDASRYYLPHPLDASRYPIYLLGYHASRAVYGQGKVVPICVAAIGLEEPDKKVIAPLLEPEKVLIVDEPSTHNYERTAAQPPSLLALAVMAVARFTDRKVAVETVLSDMSVALNTNREGVLKDCQADAVAMQGLPLNSAVIAECCRGNPLLVESAWVIVFLLRSAAEANQFLKDLVADKDRKVPDDSLGVSFDSTIKFFHDGRLLDRKDCSNARDAYYDYLRLLYDPDPHGLLICEAPPASLRSSVRDLVDDNVGLCAAKAKATEMSSIALLWYILKGASFFPACALDPWLVLEVSRMLDKKGNAVLESAGALAASLSQEPNAAEIMHWFFDRDHNEAKTRKHRHDFLWDALRIACEDHPHSPYSIFCASRPCDQLLHWFDRFVSEEVDQYMEVCVDEVELYSRSRCATALYVTTAVWLFRTDKTGAPNDLRSNFYDMIRHLCDYLCQTAFVGPPEEVSNDISRDLREGVMSPHANAYPLINHEYCALLVHGVLSLQSLLIAADRSAADRIDWKQMQEL